MWQIDNEERRNLFLLVRLGLHCFQQMKINETSIVRKHLISHMKIWSITMQELDAIVRLGNNKIKLVLRWNIFLSYGVLLLKTENKIPWNTYFLIKVLPAKITPPFSWSPPRFTKLFEPAKLPGTSFF
jgi:hypothetical protein